MNVTECYVIYHIFCFMFISYRFLIQIWRRCISTRQAGSNNIVTQIYWSEKTLHVSRVIIWTDIMHVRYQLGSPFMCLMLVSLRRVWGYGQISILVSHAQVRAARKYAIGTQVDLSGTIAHMRSALVLVYTCGLRTHVYTSTKDPNIFFCVPRKVLGKDSETKLGRVHSKAIAKPSGVALVLPPN